jgi:hypothetical protein
MRLVFLSRLADFGAFTQRLNCEWKKAYMEKMGGGHEEIQFYATGVT